MRRIGIRGRKECHEDGDGKGVQADLKTPLLSIDILPRRLSAFGFVAFSSLLASIIAIVVLGWSRGRLEDHEIATEVVLPMMVQEEEPLRHIRPF